MFCLGWYLALDTQLLRSSPSDKNSIMFAILISVPTSSDISCQGTERSSRFHITLDMLALAQLITYVDAQRLATVRIYMSIKSSFFSNEIKNSRSMVSSLGRFRASKPDESSMQLRRRCYWYTTAH